MYAHDMRESVKEEAIKMIRTVFEAIRLDDFDGLVDDVGHVDLSITLSLDCDTQQSSDGSTYTDDMLRASFGCEHAQDTRATAHIEYDLVPEEMGVVDDGCLSSQLGVRISLGPTVWCPRERCIAEG